MNRKALQRTAAAATAALLLALTWCSPAGATGIKLWWDTFEDGNLNGWTIGPVAGASIAIDNTQANTGIRSLKVTGNSGANQGAHAQARNFPIDFSYDYTVQFAFRYASFHWDQWVVFGHIRLLLDYPHLPILYDPAGDYSYPGHPVGNAFNTYLAANTWAWITIHCRPSVRQYTIFVNGTLVGTVTYNAGLATTPRLFFEDNFSVNNYLNAWYDDFSVWGMQGPQGGVLFINPSYVPPPDPENTVAWAQPPDVPWHSQFGWTAQNPDIAQGLAEPCSPPRAGQQNGRCMVASLDMVFDRYETLPPANVPPNPQEEIAAAANTSDRPNMNCQTGGPGNWFGTYGNDCRRAAHFSNATKARTGTRQGCPPAGCPGARGAAGYTWRSLGYSALDSVWTALATTDSVNVGLGMFPQTLETFLASGYPIIAYFPTPPPGYCTQLYADAYEGQLDLTHCNPENTVNGHAVVVIGYDNIGGQVGNTFGGPAFLIHDPGVGKYAWIPAGYFWTTVWVGKRFVFAAPWELMWLSPKSWGFQCKWNGSLLISYTGPKPLNGFYPVNNVQAKVVLGMLGLDAADVQVHNVGTISQMGDWGYSTWKIIGKPKPPCPVPPCIVMGSVDYSAWGTLNPAASSHSYANYADKVGGSARDWKWMSGNCAVKPIDLSHYGWPYSGRWWSDEYGGSSLQVIDTGGPTVLLTAKLANIGLQATPGGTCSFYYGDPRVSEKSPGGTYIGSAPIPTLAPDDTVTVGPIPWTRPPANSFGESFFDVWTEISVSGDTPSSVWPQDENNYGTLAEFQSEALIGAPASMSFLVTNPETQPMDIVLHVARDTGSTFWSVVLKDTNGQIIPQDVPIPMAASASFTAKVLVTPTTEDTLASINVESNLYTTGGSFVRCTGGIAFTLHLPTLVGDAGPTERLGQPVLALAQNTPNPASGATVIRYSLPKAGMVRLLVFDVAGRLVRTLVDGEVPAGWHEIRWAGECDRGGRAAAGLYFYRLDLEGRNRITRKLILTR